MLGEQPRQRILRASQANLRRPREIGVRNIGASDFRVFRVGLQRDEAAIAGQGASEPNRAIAAESAYFQDIFRAVALRQYVQEFALYRRNVDGFEPRCLARLERGFERGIGWNVKLREVCIDVSPCLFGHEYPNVA